MAPTVHQHALNIVSIHADLSPQTFSISCLPLQNPFHTTYVSRSLRHAKSSNIAERDSACGAFPSPSSSLPSDSSLPRQPSSSSSAAGSSRAAFAAATACASRVILSEARARSWADQRTVTWDTRVLLCMQTTSLERKLINIASRSARSGLRASLY